MLIKLKGGRTYSYSKESAGAEQIKEISNKLKEFEGTEISKIKVLDCIEQHN
jgi:hypothetical protein